MEALRQQVWKCALIGCFRLKSRLRKMSSDCNLDFSRGQSSQFRKRKKKEKKECLNVHIWGEYV